MAGRMSARDRHGPLSPPAPPGSRPPCAWLCLPLPHAHRLHPVVRWAVSPHLPQASRPGLQEWVLLGGRGREVRAAGGTPLPRWPSLRTPVVLPFSTLRGESLGLTEAGRLACGRQRALGPLAPSPREGAGMPSTRLPHTTPLPQKRGRAEGCSAGLLTWGSCPGWTVSQVLGPVRHGTRGQTWYAHQATRVFSWPTDHLQPAGARRLEHG